MKCDSCGGMHESRADAATCKMDNVAKCDAGNIVKRIGQYRIVEGTGTDGGDWFAIGRGETKRFKSRREAEEHAEQSRDPNSRADEAFTKMDKAARTDAKPDKAELIGKLKREIKELEYSLDPTNPNCLRGANARKAASSDLYDAREDLRKVQAYK